MSRITTAPVPARPWRRPIERAWRLRAQPVARARAVAPICRSRARRAGGSPRRPAFSAPLSSQPGICALNAISGMPSASSAAVWPMPHQAPRRAAGGCRRRSAATSDVTATRWSGSDACRSPSRNAIASATSERGAVEQAADEAVELLDRGEQEVEAHCESSIHMTPGTARAARTSPRATTTTADAAGMSGREPARGDARRHEPPGVDDGHAEPGEGAGEAEAEGDDQEHPERRPRAARWRRAARRGPTGRGEGRRRRPCRGALAVARARGVRDASCACACDVRSPAEAATAARSHPRPRPSGRTTRVSQG